ncbi:hypothetical protein OS965_02525 [Streptomyces sp. H27-G5]|uniref:DUF6582 domain-containing protein n=1 Tax=Streptomyces sp. H27-G5 TaxID=2996698 RepID=UPI00226E2BCE|nr:DUF6582 domain-containing protein [Streptomyces sp. H27-G5]MCY0917052.1 hypothetical protein [Streptomyces sp. H27-G5]
MASIGTVTGVALVPGVSRNGRLYTAETIGRAVARAQARIAAGEQPLTMLSHHAADDDSTQIVGRITTIEQDDSGAALYTADLADTKPARTIAALVDTTDGPPYLRGVSIRGAWVGKVRREAGPNGATVEAGDDLEIDGLDFTRKPGVLGARVDTYTPAGGQPTESAPDGRVLITESVQEALVHTVSETADQPAAVEAAGPYADPGYQADKTKRYPLDTKAHAKSAWVRVHESETARSYTSAQLKRVRQRIGKALRGFNVEVATEEGWLIDPIGRVSEGVAECLGFSDDPGHGGSMSVSLTNGPTTVTVTSYCVDPHDLDAVGRAAMAGACQAIAAIDPDLEADLPAVGADEGDAATSESVATQTSAPETPAADTTTLEEETAMAESTTPAAETAAAPATGGVTLTDEQFKALLAAVAPQPAAVESAPAEPVAEAAPVAATAAAVTETDEGRIQRLVSEGIKAALPQAVQEHVEATGGPSRKGLVTPVTETAGAVSGTGLPDGWPAKPFHEYSDEEWKATGGAAVVGAILGNRAPAEG